MHLNMHLVLLEFFVYSLQLLIFLFIYNMVSKVDAAVLLTTLIQPDITQY